MIAQEAELWSVVNEVPGSNLHWHFYNFSLCLDLNLIILPVGVFLSKTLLNLTHNEFLANKDVLLQQL